MTVLFLGTPKAPHRYILDALSDKPVVYADWTTPKNREMIITKAGAVQPPYEAIIVSDFDVVLADNPQAIKPGGEIAQWLSTLRDKSPVIAYARGIPSRIPVERELAALDIPTVRDTQRVGDIKGLENAIEQRQPAMAR